MKASELRELTDEELRVRLHERRESLVRFRIQMITGRVDDVKAARTTRRDIARILMVMGERKKEAK